MIIKSANFMGEEIQIIEESYCDYSNFDFVDEAKDISKQLKHTDVWLCHYPDFPVRHQDRPSIIINSKGFGPLIMVTAHVEPGKDEWKNYKENVFVEDWFHEGFKLPSYANTKGLYYPHEVKIYRKLGTLTNNDIKRIVDPTLKRLEKEKMREMFESVELEYIMDFLE